MHTKAKYTGFEPYDPAMNGPAGVQYAVEADVEVVGFRHDEHGIASVKLRREKDGAIWWTVGEDELDGVEVRRAE